MHTKKYILYADDDVDDIELLESTFSHVDPELQVRSVPNGEELLKYLDKVDTPDAFPCLIVLDLNMPKMTGEQALAVLKKHQQYCEIPVVLFSTSAHIADLESIQKCETVFIVKPESLEKWRKAASQMLQYCHFSVQHQPHHST